MRRVKTTLQKSFVENPPVKLKTCQRIEVSLTPPSRMRSVHRVVLRDTRPPLHIPLCLYLSLSHTHASHSINCAAGGNGGATIIAPRVCRKLLSCLNVISVYRSSFRGVICEIPCLIHKPARGDREMNSSCELGPTTTVPSIGVNIRDVT